MRRMWGLLVGVAMATTILAYETDARAHCDTVDGPVVSAARRALDSGNVNHVLIWVQPDDADRIRDAFDHAREERRSDSEFHEASDRAFFETLVRIHRAGEGAAYEGLKPAGTEVGPAVRAADESVERGTAEPVHAVVTEAVSNGIDERFSEVKSAGNFDVDDVEAGRAYVASYVGYTHFVEGVHEATQESHAHQHREGGHGDEHAPMGAHHAGLLGVLGWALSGLFGVGLVAESWMLLRRRRESESA